MDNLIRHGIVFNPNSLEFKALIDFIGGRENEILADVDDLGTLKPVLNMLKERESYIKETSTQMKFDCRLARQ